MEVSQVENTPRPPGIIQSIKAGFDVIANHIHAILFPLLMNLFLWLGPRLQMNELFYSIRSELITMWQSGGFSPEDIQRALNWYETTLPGINLFWLLRTIPIGISSLQFPPESQTPLGDPAVWQVGTLELFGAMFFFTLIGWVGGGLYFQSVAKVTFAEREWQSIGMGRAMFQSVFLSFTWSVLVFFLAIPVLIMLALLMQVSQSLANLAMLFLAFLSMWVIVPMYFWSHGVFVRGENFFTSMLSSLKITRVSLPTSSMFVLTVFLLSFGLNLLWYISPVDSWITLLAVFGHSFVTTALLSASFIYYRDLTIWIQAVMEKMAARISINK